MTNTATQFIENKDDVEKFLPSVSVCPLPAFKKPGSKISTTICYDNSSKKLERFGNSKVFYIDTV